MNFVLSLLLNGFKSVMTSAKMDYIFTFIIEVIWSVMLVVFDFFFGVIAREDFLPGLNGTKLFDDIFDFVGFGLIGVFING